MAKDFFKIKKGANLSPISAASVVNPQDGDLIIDSSDGNQLKRYDSGTTSWVTASVGEVSANSTNTFTNKTIDGDNNTILDLGLGTLKTVLGDANKVLRRDAAGAVVSDKTAPTGDFVGTTDTQTLTGKTIDGDTNTIQDLALSTLKTDAPNANKVLRRDAGGIVVSDKDAPTGNFVGTTDTQTLTNKTLTTPTISGQISDKIDFTKAAAPATPAVGRLSLYAKTDDKVYYKTDAGIEKEVGSGASGVGKNYFGDYEADNVANVTRYNDGGTTLPVDGTGGVVTGLTTTLDTTSQLSGTNSYKLSKDAANRQGQGFTITTDQTLDAIVKAGKTVTVQFSYKTSSTYASGDIKMFVYRVGSNVLEPLNGWDGNGTYGNSLNKDETARAQFTANVTLSSSDTALRLIFHVATASATAHDVFVDRVLIGENSQIVTSTTTDWISYTPTGSWTTNTTYSGRYRRIGDTLEAEVLVLLSGAPNTTALNNISLPPGLTMDNTKMTTANTATRLGSGEILDGATNSYPATVLWSSNTAVAPAPYNAAGTYALDAAVTNTVPFTFGSGDNVTLAFRVPISQWADGGNTINSTQADFRTPKFRAFRSTTSASGTGNLNLIADSVSYNEQGIYNPTTGFFRPNKTGPWRVSTETIFNGVKTLGNPLIVQLLRVSDNAIIAEVARFVNQASNASLEVTIIGSATPTLTAGVDYKFVALRGADSNTVYGDTTGLYSYISAEYLPDLSVVGNAGTPLEVKSATSATHTPVAGSVWHALTGNSIVLTEGVWDLTGYALFASSGGPAGYTNCAVTFALGNGTNGALPATLNTASTLSVLSGFETGFGGWNIDIGSGNLNATRGVSPTVTVRVTVPTTVFLVTTSAQTTTANARITVYATAKRIR